MEDPSADPPRQRRELARSIARWLMDSIGVWPPDTALRAVRGMALGDRQFLLSGAGAAHRAALEALGMVPPANPRAAIWIRALLPPGEERDVLLELQKDPTPYPADAVQEVLGAFREAIDASSRFRGFLSGRQSVFRDRVQAMRAWWEGSLRAAGDTPLLEKTSVAYGLLWFLKGDAMQPPIDDFPDLMDHAGAIGGTLFYERPYGSGDNDPLSNLMRTIHRAPRCPVPTRLYRHVGLHEAPAVGALLPHPMPHSTSARASLSTAWSRDYDKDACCLLEIRVPAGYPGFYYGPPPFPMPGDGERMAEATGFNAPVNSEYEVILPPASYRVLEVKTWNLSARSNAPGAAFFGTSGIEANYAAALAEDDDETVVRNVYVVEPVPLEVAVARVDFLAHLLGDRPSRTYPLQFATVPKGTEAFDLLSARLRDDDAWLLDPPFRHATDPDGAEGRAARACLRDVQWNTEQAGIVFSSPVPDTFPIEVTQGGLSAAIDVKDGRIAAMSIRLDRLRHAPGTGVYWEPRRGWRVDDDSAPPRKRQRPSAIAKSDADFRRSLATAYNMLAEVAKAIRQPLPTTASLPYLVYTMMNTPASHARMWESD